MLEILNKFVAFIAIGVIGYLTYSSLNGPASSLAKEGKEIPIIAKQMLSPVFLKPENRSSPISRDPFDMGWDNDVGLSASAAVRRPAEGSVGDDNNVAFPEKLMGIISGADGQRLAFIGSEVYGIGSSVKLVDANELWEIFSIDDESVVLTRNGLRAVLKIENDYNDVQTGNSEDKGQKESTQ